MKNTLGVSINIVILPKNGKVNCLYCLVIIKEPTLS